MSPSIIECVGKALNAGGKTTDLGGRDIVFLNCEAQCSLFTVFERTPMLCCGVQLFLNVQILSDQRCVFTGNLICNRLLGIPDTAHRQWKLAFTKGAYATKWSHVKHIQNNAVLRIKLLSLRKRTSSREARSMPRAQIKPRRRLSMISPALSRAKLYVALPAFPEGLGTSQLHL